MTESWMQLCLLKIVPFINCSQEKLYLYELVLTDGLMML